MRVVTSNIRNNPDLPREKVRAAAAETAKLGGVIFFQEIGEKEDHIDLETTMGEGFSWVGRNIAIPIAFRHKYWTKMDEGSEIMHGPLRGVTPTRMINWVLLKRKPRTRRGAAKHTKVTCFMNTHFISGAWNDKEKLDKDWRKKAWLVHWEKMQAKILEFVAQGITVVFGGDWNRLKVAPFSAEQKWLVEHGLDKIGIIEAPGGTKVRTIWPSGHMDVTHVHDHQAAWCNIYIA